MASPKLTLYFDVVSTFAYLAFYVLYTSPVFKKCDITYVPVFLGGVMKFCGNTPPLNIKNKNKWIARERTRWASKFKIPIADGIPEGFPMNTLQVQRALCVLQQKDPNGLPDTLAAVYKAVWVDHANIQDENVIQEILARTVGAAEAEELIIKSKESEAKQALSKNTEIALADECFGLPYFCATNSKGTREFYWGFDHLGQVVDHLGIGAAHDLRTSEEGWRAML